MGPWKRFAEGSIVVGLLLGGATGNAGAKDAVATPGVALVAPIYQYGVVSESGWRDQPRARSHTFGGNLEIVAPVNDRTGIRVGVGGAASRAELDPEPPGASSDFTGAMGPAVSLFQRDPDRFELGVGYAAVFGFAPQISHDRSHTVSGFAALFRGDFDVDGLVGYQRVDARGELVGSGGASTVDEESDGVQLRLAGTWYASKRLALALEGHYAYTSAELVSGAANLELRRDAGGTTLAARLLPPTGELDWLVLESWLSYARSRARETGGNVSTGASESLNAYGIGASVRIQLPGVESLAELRRQY